MNMNDKRARVDIKEIFDKEILKKMAKIYFVKTTGYISYVRGENPYTFPFRVYPDIFSPVIFLKQTYPSYQMNGNIFLQKIQSLKNHFYQIYPCINHMFTKLC